MTIPVDGFCSSRCRLSPTSCAASAGMKVENLSTSSCDRVGAGDQGEEADREQEHRRNREERAVGERRRDHRQAVVDRLLSSPLEDREPVGLERSLGPGSTSRRSRRSGCGSGPVRAARSASECDEPSMDAAYPRHARENDATAPDRRRTRRRPAWRRCRSRRARAGSRRGPVMPSRVAALEAAARHARRDAVARAPRAAEDEADACRGHASG